MTQQTLSKTKWKSVDKLKRQFVQTININYLKIYIFPEKQNGSGRLDCEQSFFLTMDSTKEIFINDIKYLFKTHLTDDSMCHIHVTKLGSYEEQNKKKYQKELEDFQNYEKKIRHAFKKTNEKITLLTKEFYQKLSEEKEFGEQFTQKNEELFALIAGDLRISEESKNILDNIRQQKTISINEIKKEEFSWKMKFGDQLYFKELMMEFWFCQDGQPIDEKIDTIYEKVEVPLHLHNDQELVEMLRDVIIEENGKSKLRRMKVQETDEFFVCEFVEMQNKKYIGTKKYIAIEKEESDRIHKIKKYKASDLKAGEGILALIVDGAHCSNLRFVRGRIQSIAVTSAIEHIQMYTHMVTCDITCDITGDTIRKITDIPEKFRNTL
ncbi:MAG: hypothetical protein Dasosvirus1_12 [Dasosvirus sp.]|uniref:Uncharacterized protein n=1 Tax=Dasosvirus sp. TaxID=2487764 RepID=A0A3G4ZR54_9VIRU|nr:MAG: hypothetical protein Dasosvirus1_12 [Dasosvirus sp.]